MLALREQFFEALADDFNTPRALAVVNEWIREATSGVFDIEGDQDLREMLGVLGLESLLAATAQAPEAVLELAERREHARFERDFAAADRLRDEIAALGWEVRDGPRGFELPASCDHLRSQPGARGAARHGAPQRGGGVGDGAAPRASRGWPASR